MIRSGS